MIKFSEIDLREDRWFCVIRLVMYGIYLNDGPKWTNEKIVLTCVLDDDVNIGTAAKFRLQQLISSEDVSSIKFIDMLRRFMLTITQNLCNNLPLENDLLHAHAQTYRNLCCPCQHNIGPCSRYGVNF